MRRYLAVLAIVCLLLCSGCSQPVVETEDSPFPDKGLESRETFGEIYAYSRQHTFSDIGEDFDPDLSPDGSTLLYASTAHSETSDIFTKPVNGKKFTQRTYDTANDRFPRYSPDGKWIVFSSDRSGNWDLYLMPAEPDSRKPVALTDRQGDEIHPSWSPDGKRIAYNFCNPKRAIWEIWILDLRTSDNSYICDGMLPEWCPDPSVSLILFQRYRMRDIPWFGVWTVNIERGREEEQTAIVFDERWAAINPSWSPDGKWIAFSTVYKSAEAQEAQSLFRADDLWIVDRDGQHQIQLTNNQFPEWDPNWERDGRIYFTAKINGKRNIWSVEPVTLDDEIFSESAPPVSLEEMVEHGATDPK